LKTQWLSKLRCPKCQGAVKPLSAGKSSRGRWGVWETSGVICLKCREKYPVVEGGILKMIPRGDYSRYKLWENKNAGYDAETIIRLYQARFKMPDSALLSYYRMAAMALKLGWKFRDSLDIGSGWGSYSLFLKRFNITDNVWLLDISPAALKGAMKVFKSFGLQVYPVMGDVHCLPFKDNAFDGSLSGGLFEHFVGPEQEALVRENCRVSRRVLCQLPASSLAYWTYRKILTWKEGKWPFGFEEPLKRSRMRTLFEIAGTRVRAWEFNNIASAALFQLAERHPWMQAWLRRPWPFYLFRHDLILAAEKKERGEA
jgi:uncharacterized protein YbaR (Trm112 family)